MTQKKNITFDDIAQYTHFSKTTISRYFNNPDSLNLIGQKLLNVLALRLRVLVADEYQKLVSVRLIGGKDLIQHF